MIKNLKIPENTPLTIELQDWKKTLSKEIIELVQWTAFNAMDVVLEIIWKDKSYLREFYEVADYSNEQIKNILWINQKDIVLEKEITI